MAWQHSTLPFSFKAGMATSAHKSPIKGTERSLTNIGTVNSHFRVFFNPFLVLWSLFFSRFSAGFCHYGNNMLVWETRGFEIMRGIEVFLYKPSNQKQ
jgi:hypothetical protein